MIADVDEIKDGQIVPGIAKIDQVTEYSEKGYIGHPVASPKFNDRTTGKRPIPEGWTKRTTPMTPDEITAAFKGRDNLNYGLLTGERSGVMVIDVDDELFISDLLQTIDTSIFVRVNRDGADRGHIYFKYDPDIRACKRHTIGIEILTDDKNNVIVPPSMHYTGTQYKWNIGHIPSLDEVPEMPELLKDRLSKLFATDDEVKVIKNKIRPCFKNFLNIPEMLHGADGRRFMIALAADMVANGASDEAVHMVTRLVYRDDYNYNRTAQELGNINKDKTWKCETLRNEFPEFCVCGICNNHRHAKVGTSQTETITELVKAIGDEVGLDRHRRIMKHLKPLSNLTKGEMISYVLGIADALGIKGKAVDAIHKDIKEYGELEAAVSIPIDEPEGPKTENALPPDERITDDIRKEAIDILTHGDPLNYISRVVARNHVGDKPMIIGMIASVITTSILNSNGIHPTGNGESGKGKSHAMLALSHVTPKGKILVASVSAKALFYSNIPSGTVIIMDDADIAKGLESTMKRDMTSFQEPTTHIVTDVDKSGQRVARETAIPPRTVWWNNSVDAQGSSELLNRQVNYDVDVSTKQDRAVFEHNKLVASGDIDDSIHMTREDLICVAIFEDVCSDLNRVIIQYAKHFLPLDASNRRNPELFYDFIRAFAKLNYIQREVNANGDIVASLDDYTTTTEHMTHILKNITTKLNKQERVLLGYIMNEDGITKSECAAKTGFNEQAVQNLVNGRSARGKDGLLAKIPTFYKEEGSETKGSNNDGNINTSTSKRVVYHVNADVAEAIINGKEGILCFDAEYEPIYKTHCAAPKPTQTNINHT